ncbi:MAG TPA: decarboxylating 6-phosphogluconate dehydrogenase [Candidatus Saccharimonadales bacterium]|nr:decarboxylating 6-phosphogluconate dehydrogenase [Candidatus Saccharimonadales bacterium]
MRVGLVGLGKMGGQIVARFLQAGHEVVVTDLDQAAVEAAGKLGAVSASGRQDLAQKLGTPAIVWLMIPAQAVDEEINGLLAVLPKNSIIVDGGNSDFRLTRARASLCKYAGVELVDVGTSGGVLGLEHGFSMMIGGEPQAFAAVEPLIQALAQPNGYKHFGPHGAGHYVKMIHNAIEYGMMESYAEGWRLLKDGKDYPGLDLAAIADVWQHGSIIQSELNGLTANIFAENPTLEGIDGYVAESGEARWTLEVAKSQNFAMPAIQSAFDVRIASGQGRINFGTKVLAAMRNAFGGHKLNK